MSNHDHRSDRKDRCGVFWRRYTSLASRLSCRRRKPCGGGLSGTSPFRSSGRQGGRCPRLPHRQQPGESTSLITLIKKVYSKTSEKRPQSVVVASKADIQAVVPNRPKSCCRKNQALTPECFRSMPFRLRVVSLPAYTRLTFHFLLSKLDLCGKNQLFHPWLAVRELDGRTWDGLPRSRCRCRGVADKADALGLRRATPDVQKGV